MAIKCRAFMFDCFTKNICMYQSAARLQHIQHKWLFLFTVVVTAFLLEWVCHRSQYPTALKRKHWSSINGLNIKSTSIKLNSIIMQLRVGVWNASTAAGWIKNTDILIFHLDPHSFMNYVCPVIRYNLNNAKRNILFGAHQQMLL